MRAAVVAIGDILLEIQAGKSVKTKERPAQPGEVGILKVSAVTWGQFDPTENKAVLDGYDPGECPRPMAGDLLISRANTRELVGAPVLVEKDHPNLLLSDKILRLVPDLRQVDRRYLARHLQSAASRAHFERRAGGTSGSMTNITQDDVRTAPLLLPPLPEQRRVADILDKADAIRRKRKEAIALTEDLLRSAFLEMFGDPVTNPKGWPLRSVGEVSDVAGGLQVTSARSSNPVVMPYLRVANVYRDRLDLTEVKDIRVTVAERERATLQSGDVLVVEGHGNPEELGRSAVWGGEVAGCTHQNHLIRVRAHRERKQGAAPQDFELIATEFHRWVRDHEEALGLTGSAEFARFIERDFAFYGGWYERLRRAAEAITPGLECVHFNAQHNFTLQYPVLLAALRVEDGEESVLRKLRVVAAYLDILIHRRIWNWRAIDYSTMQYAMFLVMRDIRGKSAPELAEMLKGRFDPETAPDFAGNSVFRLHGMNGRQIHRVLARMTDYVETQSGQASRYGEYAQRGRKGYEIEHVWADHPERHTKEFGHASEFLEYRNRIGGLLLLPKSFNASYGDLPYAEKRTHYAGQNLLARSLHESAYDHNPGFKRFTAERGLQFQAHAEFMKADLDARQLLYRQLAEQIWSPERLVQAATAKMAT
jgi:hypothetical protein